MGYLLGNAVYSRILEEVLVESGVTTVPLRLSEAEYDHPAPRWAMIGQTPRCAYQHRRLLRESALDPLEFDALVFQTYHAAIPYGDVLNARPGVLALDSTPALDWRRNSMRPARLTGRARRGLGKAVGDHMVRKAFGRMRHFFAWSEAVKASLMHDYGVPESRIEVTYVPVPSVTPRRFERAAVPRMLFVGNDFVRKGGPDLVRVFDERFADRADLIVVSRDAARHVDFSRTRAQHLSGLSRSEVVELMRSCDLFVFPSESDALGIVLLEALKCGLPVVAKDSGSQAELVKDGLNGMLLANDAPRSALAEALERMLSNPEQLASMGRASLSIAEKIWDRDQLASRLLAVLQSAVEY
ncbi:glycosyltransferase family 4 protein [Gemmatimonadota bacterium DH-20]|uniref:Glycosyltransferase family 4 protein n=1 Tax=Gaopeijia maritima TaxID=3119007 RepID=A0ABU9E3U9_9BACT